MRPMRYSMLIATAGLSLSGLALAGCGGAKQGGIPEIAQGEPTLGSATAPVTMIEYASLSCPHCARFNNDVFPAFKAKYIDTGQVRYSLREIMTPPYAFAGAAFLLAKCVPPEKYYPVVDAVYHAQTDIMQSGDQRGGLTQIGIAAGLSKEAVDKCVTDEKALEALNKRNVKNAKDGKINGTPTFFMNGRMVASSEVTAEQLDKFVAAAKADAAKAKK